MDLSTIKAMSPGVATAQSEIAQLRRIAGNAHCGDNNDKRAALETTCEKFEAVFLRMLFQQMRNSIPESGIFGERSQAMSMYQEMMDGYLADELAESRGLGIAAMLERELGKVYEFGADNETERAETSQRTSTKAFLTQRSRSLIVEESHHE